jgi:hypothetical protein
MIKLEKKIILIFLLLISLSLFGESSQTVGIRETKLNYNINYQALEEGNFQFFYCLLKQKKNKNGNEFENLSKEDTNTPTNEIVESFISLDTKGEWDIDDDNYLAVAKFNFILPVNIKSIDENRFTETEYLQNTLPRYKVTKKDGYYHVAGSLLTPNFDLRLFFLNAKHPLTNSLKEIKKDKIKNGSMKVTYIHQTNFGRVMMFRTAKMASVMIIYEKLDENNTMVSQFILSNIINVPTKAMIKKGMIDNLKDVVIGSRQGVTTMK